MAPKRKLQPKTAPVVAPNDSGIVCKSQEFYRLDFFCTIKVLIGPSQKAFFVPESCLVEHSAFFRAAYTGSRKEAAEGIIKLPEVDFDAFSSFVQYIYPGEIVVAPEKSTRESGQYFEDMAKLWILSDQLDHVSLRNAVIDDIIDCVAATHLRPAPRATVMIWQGTTKLSTLRCLCVEYYACGADAGYKDMCYGSSIRALSRSCY